MAILQILVGPIASGKSTYCKSAAKSFCVICNDDSIVNTVHGGNYELYDKKYKPLYKTVENTIVTSGLSHGADVVIDRGTNNKVSSRRRFIGLAHSIDHKAVAVIFPRDLPEVHAKRRVESDSRGLSLEYWLQVAEFHEKEYQIPTVAEGFDDIWHITWEQIQNGEVY